MHWNQAHELVGLRSLDHPFLGCSFTFRGRNWQRISCDKLFVSGQTDMDEVSLLLKSLNDGCMCNDIGVKLVLSQVKPLNVKDFVSQFLADLQGKLFETVLREVDRSDFLNVE